jgi:CDGSH-type Zn-finger protein
MVVGLLKVVDADGTEYDLSQQTTYFLCRCGHSSTKPPFCDGTHEKSNFAAVNRAASRSTPMRSPAVASR